MSNNQNHNNIVMLLVNFASFGFFLLVAIRANINACFESNRAVIYTWTGVFKDVMVIELLNHLIIPLCIQYYFHGAIS